MSGLALLTQMSKIAVGALLGPAPFSSRTVVRDGQKLEALLVPAASGGQTSLEAFVCSASAFIPLLRAALDVAEGELGLHSYHMRLVKTSGTNRAPTKHGLAKLDAAAAAAADAAGCYLLVAGDYAPTRDAPRAAALEDMDAPIEYEDAAGTVVSLGLRQRDVCVAEGASCRCFLDAQGRAMYVSCLKRFVRRQSECTDAELAELWRLPFELAQQQTESGVVDARINAGSYQNVAHLHLKVWLRPGEFEAKWAGDPVWEQCTAARRERLATKNTR